MKSILIFVEDDLTKGGDRKRKVIQRSSNNEPMVSVVVPLLIWTIHLTFHV